MPNGCNWPDTCKLGRHDPEFKGKGTKGGGKGGDKGNAKGKAKGDKSKGKPDGKAGGKGGDPKTTGNPAKLPDDALVDSEGKSLFYALIHGKCNGPSKCDRYHGPETPAMQKKRLTDEKRMAEKAAAQAGNPKAATTQPKLTPKFKQLLPQSRDSAPLLWRGTPVSYGNLCLSDLCSLQLLSHGKPPQH